MAWQLTLGLMALQWFKQKYLTPKPRVERQRAADLGALARNLYDAGEGDPLPILYGTVRVPGQIVWAGRFSTEPVNPPPPENGVIGHRYRAAIQMVFGASNCRISTGRKAVFRNLFVGDKRIAVGPSADPEVFTIQENDFYGGQGFGGGLNGRMIFQGGSWDQVVHPYWSATYGSAPAGMAAGDVTLLPAYRGQIVACFIGAENTGFLLGEEPRIEPWQLEIYNPVSIPGQTAGVAAIGGGDANPASVLYDLLTHPWGRGQLAAADVDVASFVAAAATLEAEQHGISIAFASTSDAAECIKEVERQVDGAVFIDPTTGKYTLKLIREDYDPNAIPVFGPDEVCEPPQITSSTWDETFNEVRVVYSDREQYYTDRVALAQDLAVIAAQGGRRRSKEIRFPGVSNRKLAAWLAARTLNLVARPIVRLRVSLNRSALRLTRAAPFRFDWPELGFSMVFRVADIDYGKPGDGRIVVEAMQDRFDIPWSVFDPGGVVVVPLPVPVAPAARLVTEAPRWLMLQAFNAGVLNDPEIQRGFYLARVNGADVLYRVRAGLDAAASVTDLDATPFPATATVETAYARALDPYDTVTGLRLTGLAGTTAAELVASSATESEISTTGKHLGYCGGEILSWETATDLGGGVVRLNNVARGRMDTVPKTLPVGEPFYFLPLAAGGEHIGGSGIAHGTDVVARTQGGTGLAWQDEEFAPYDAFTSRSRALLPYPPADEKVNASKTPSTLVEGGVVVDFKRRDRTMPALTRGDAASETVEAGTTYALIARKGTRANAFATGLVGPVGTVYALGSVGHGTIDVEVEAQRTATLPSGEAASLSAWDNPAIQVSAPHWRNLLINGRFADGLNYWTSVTGTATTSSGANGLGGTGSWLADAGASGLGVNRYQDVEIQGYDPTGLTAVLDFFNRASDTNDTMTVTLQSLDAGGSVLQTATYGPSIPALNEWRRQTIQIAGLHASTAKLRVRVVMTWVGEVDGKANVQFTEAILRVGQQTSQLLSEPSFETGITGWTTVSGTWGNFTPTQKYSGTLALRNSTDVASAEVYQQVAVPTGYDRAAVAVLEFAQVNTAASDTGEVILEARSGGGAVLASTTTGATTTTTNVWQRRRLTLELPADTATVRVRVLGTRAVATNIDVGWDDFDLRLHKHLDPDAEVTYSFESPATQALPRGTEEWRAWLPDVDPPNVAIFDGAVTGRLGTEALMEADDDILLGATCVARQPAMDGSTKTTTTAYENVTRQATDDVHTVANGTEFANFSTAQGFTALAFIKVDEHPWGGLSCGIMGRIVGGIGWSLELSDDGFPKARLVGAGGTAAIDFEPDLTMFGGGLVAVAMTYDAAADLLWLVTAQGAASVSTASIGEFKATAPGRFRLFRSSETQPSMPGQIARAYLWSDYIAPADLQSVMTYGIEAGVSPVRSGSIAVVTETNTSGVLVETFGQGQVAIGLDQASGRRGLVSSPAVANLAPASFADAKWSLQGTPTVTQRAAVDPTGYKHATSILSAYASGLQLGNLAVGVGGSVAVAWFARADVAHTASLAIEDTASGEVDVHDYAVTTSWQLFTWEAVWTNPLANGIAQLRFTSVNAGSPQVIYLSPIVFVGAVGVAFPGVIPIGNAVTSTYHSIVPTLTAQVNHEGELAVELVNDDADGVVADLANGTNSNDRRLLTFDDTSGLLFSHYDGTAGANLATAGAAVTPTTPWTARGRWCRALLPDKATPVAYSGVRAEQGVSTYVADGRGAAWTPSATLLDVLTLGAQYDGSQPLRGGRIFSVRISARERKVS